MSLSKVLESIYADKPQQDTVDLNQSAQVASAIPGIEQSSSIGKSPEDYDKKDDVPTDPLAGELESDEDCDECPKVSLAHSLIQWIKDNAETIHSVLDAVESGEYDDTDDSDDFDVFEFDDEQSNEEPNEVPNDVDYNDPEAKSKEFEETKAFADFGFEDEDTQQSNTDPELDPGLDADPEQSQMDDDASMDDLEPDDPDRQGDIRTVQDAHLVFKRKTADGTFEELWFYNVGDDASRSDDDIKRDILSGTSIDPKKLASEDGKQQYTIVTMGNGQMVHIVGMES